ncbi:MAG: hypothetical protein IJG63_05885, partial [Oscillospiraceae bacterium]|nr:hypothetical protein [Oscillospiraceae bacterium]
FKMRTNERFPEDIQPLRRPGSGTPMRMDRRLNGYSVGRRGEDDREYGLPALPKLSTGSRREMSFISEFFERDSRRYDGGFTFY